MPDSSYSRKAWLVIVPILTLLLGWQMGVRYQQQAFGQQLQRLDRLFGSTTGSGTVKTDPEREVDIGILWNVWRLLQRYYVDPSALQTQKMVYGAAAGLVQGVGDPYTLFMTPSENKDFRQVLAGKLSGIGAELVEKDKAIVVVAPLKGSPAEKAGLLPGDFIAEVDGKSIQGLTLQQVVDRIRGEKGTTVRLKIYRPKKAQPIVLAIVRDDIRIPSVESSVLKTQTGSLGYVALNQFGENSVNEVRDALLSFQKEKPEIKGIILDLRGNGGGFLEGADAIVSMFLKEGKVVSVERRDVPLEVHTVSGHPIDPDLPLVVLINGGSASASEITAGALQDHKRATIIGTDSFGKGTVQEVIDLPGGTSLRVTVAHWLTPNGKNLGKEKVHPDIKVDLTDEDIQARRDSQLEAAKRWLLEHIDVSKGISASSASESN